MNENAPTKPLTALAMSFVLPGFGQLYNGELNKAIWLFLVFAFLTAPAIAPVAVYLPARFMMPALAASVVATVGLWAFGMIDAWRGAKARTSYRPERWQLSGVYMLVLILCDILALPMFTLYVREHIVESFRIPAVSMEPAVMKGDILFADKRYNCPGCKGRIERGDIAIFTYPNDRTLRYIKRIIALPGDRVTLDDGTLSVNGKPLSAPGNPALEAENGRSWTVQPAHADKRVAGLDMTVPAGEVFVLGDNRSASVDSRSFGAVPMQDVVGRARQVWLSIGRDGVRWDRLGKVLQ